MDDELWRALVEANSRLMLLEGSGQRLISPSIFLRPLQRREAIRSSTIEHIDATAEELLLFDLSVPPTSEEQAAEGLREVSNYERALRHGLDLLDTTPVSLRFIRELHRVLLIGVRGSDKTPGEFRRVQVSIGSRFTPPPPNELADCLSAMESFIHARSDVDPLIRVFWVHYQFEAIHPFRDGNGRVGRLLLAIMLKAFCGLSQPWLYMSAWFERHRDDYMDLLFRVSTEGAWRDWTYFCLRGAAVQADESVVRITRLLDLHARYLRILSDSPGAGTLRLAQTLDELFASPVLTTPLVQQRRGIDFKTAQRDIERLVSAGILEEVAGRRPRTFVAREILRVAHEETD